MLPGQSSGHGLPAPEITQRRFRTFLFTLASGTFFWPFIFPLSDRTVVFHSFTIAALPLVCPEWEPQLIRKAEKAADVDAAGLVDGRI